MIVPVLKPKLLRIHRWVGLAVAILLTIQALSGVLLVFREELDGLLHPAIDRVHAPARFALQPLVDAAANAVPGARLQKIELPDHVRRSAIATLRRPDGNIVRVALDPTSGAVLRRGGYAQWPTEWLFHLHNNLFSEGAGKIVVALDGAMLVLLAGLGLAVWWPAGRLTRRAWRIDRGHGGVRLLRSVHRSLGAIAAPVLVLSATTGVMMLFSSQLRTLAGAAPRPYVAVKASDQPLAPVDALAAAARKVHGTLELADLRFSGARSEVVVLYFADPASWRADATRQYTYDRRTGRELARYEPGRLDAKTTMFDWLYSVHTGISGRLPGRLIIFAGGLSLLFLALTGPWLWFAGSRRRRRPD